MISILKKIVKSILPMRLVYLMKTNILYWSDIKKYACYSSTYKRLNNLDKVKGQLTILYHIIEKGLTMPETRYGFGKKVIFELADLCVYYMNHNFDRKDQVFTHSVEVLNEYVMFHKNNGISLEEDVLNTIEKVASMSEINGHSKQQNVSRDNFFKYSESSFPDFCMSRHSARNFSDEEISLETIYKCIDLANNSPSDCNRQPSRVYLIKNKQTILDVLNLQNGNRGFGHLANKLLIITSDISLFQGNERNEPFLNAGLFAMSLLYALHFNRIGACLLNWAATNSDDRKLRNIINVPEKEQIAVIIACGYIPDKIKVANSPRIPAKDITREI